MYKQGKKKQISGNLNLQNLLIVFYFILFLYKITMKIMDIDRQNISDLNLTDYKKKHHSSSQIQHSLRLLKIKSIQDLFENQNEGHVRHQQNLFLYFINLAMPISISYLNAYGLLSPGQNQQLNAELIIIFVALSFFLSIYTCWLIAPWRQILRLYFHFDFMIPVIVASSISLFSLINFSTTGKWYEYGYGICFPLWIVPYAGSLRVMIAHLNWNRWQVVLYKLVVLACALIFFYVGFTYMNGVYKITSGYLVSVDDTFKNIVYLYVFGFVQLFFQYFRMLSQFDQTKHLKFEYKFQNESVNLQKIISTAQLQQLQRELIQGDIEESILRQKTQSNKHTSQQVGELVEKIQP